MISPKAALAGVLAVSSMLCEAGTIYVDGTSGNDAWNGLCETWDGAQCGPKKTIQSGIDSAVDGDEILLADGSYAGTGNAGVSFGGKAIVLRSQNGPQGCVIDGQLTGRGLIFTNGETLATIIEGISFRRMSGVDQTIGGSAIFVKGAAVTVRECVFEACDPNVVVVRGGNRSDLLLDDCVFVGNGPCVVVGRDDYDPPAWTGATIRGCVFRQNMDPRVYISVNNGGRGWVVDCRFSDNVFKSSMVEIQRIAPAESPLMEQCLIVNNRVMYGYENNGSLVSNLGASLSSCVIACNTHGVWMDSEGAIENCVIAYNVRPDGPAYVMYSSGRIRNNIVWGNWPHIQVQMPMPGSVVSNNCIQGGFPIPSNIGVDPMFCDAVGNDLNPMIWDDHDYHVLPGSPCVGRGFAGSFGLGQVDIDGEPRVMGGRVDIGVDEFTARPFVFGDANCDGVRDFADIDAFVTALGGEAAYLTEYPDCFWDNADCDDDDQVDFADIDAFVALLGA